MQRMHFGASLVTFGLAGALVTGCGEPAADQASNPSAGNTPGQSTAADRTETPDPRRAPAEPAKVAEGDYKTTDSGLKYAVLEEGTGGEVAGKEQDVKVHYTGWLKSSGEKFDSSLDRGEPFQLALGHGQVIPGWDEGVQGMKVGEKRQLVIPPALGYGAQGTPGGPIPPNATLVFDVELVELGAKHQH